MDKQIAWEMKTEKRMCEPLPEQTEQLAKSFNAAVLVLDGVVREGCEEVAFHNTFKRPTEAEPNMLSDLYLLLEKGTYPPISI